MSADATALLAADRLAAELGVSLVEGRADTTVVEMAVGPRHTNFLGMVHGGVVFSLADIAMALAANADQDPAVAIDTQISFVRAARPGDRLTARAVRTAATRSLAWYQVQVENQEGKKVGLFQGTVYRPGR